LFPLLFGNRAAVKVPAGRHLFLQDDKSASIFGLVAGTVELVIYSIEGQELVVNTHTGMTIVGEMGALDGKRRNTTAVCRTECTIVSLCRAQLLRCIEENPFLARLMLQLVCDRAREVTELLGDRTFLCVGTRLAKRLLVLDTLLADPPAGWIAVSQTEIAESLGATRESVNKLLNGWKSRALIDIRRGHVKVADLFGLRRLATSGEEGAGLFPVGSPVSAHSARQAVRAGWNPRSRREGEDSAAAADSR
jgi:CRP-like cAMP-binding protein